MILPVFYKFVYTSLVITFCIYSGNLIGQNAMHYNLSSYKALPLETMPRFSIGINIEPGFSKLKPVDRLTFYQPSLQQHNGLFSFLTGYDGLHLAAYQPAIDLGIRVKYYMFDKFGLSSGIFFSKVGGRLIAQGVVYAQNPDGDILQNSSIDSTYAFTNRLYHMEDIKYRGNYIMVPLILELVVLTGNVNMNFAIGTRQYFLLSGSAEGSVDEITLAHNSFGYNSVVYYGFENIDLTNEMQNFFIAPVIGMEFSWQINDHLLFELDPDWVFGFTNIMKGESNIFIAQYGSTYNFENGGDVLPLLQNFKLRKFGIGIGLQYEF